METQELIDNLLKTAKEGKHRPFEFIRNMNEYSVAKTTMKATQKVSRAFSKEATEQYNNYLSQLEQKIDNPQLLVNHQFFKKAAKFYSEEADLLYGSLYEYRCYLLAGHVIDAMLGKYRPEEDLVDYSGLGYTVEDNVYGS